MTQARLKRYHDNAINMRISLDGYGSKTRKVRRWRPTILNETILATKKEIFVTEIAPIQSITELVLLAF